MTWPKILGFVGALSLAIGGFAEESLDPPPFIPSSNQPQSSSTPGFQSSASCQARVGYGPLRVESHSPFQALRLAPAPKSPANLSPGRWELISGLTWANIWGRDLSVEHLEADEMGRFRVDFETLQSRLELNYGLSHSLQLGVVYEHRNWFGGEMDSFIQNFHDAFSIDQGGRDSVPKNERVLYLNYGDGQRFDLKNTGVLRESLTFTFQHHLSCGSPSRPAMAWGGSFRWPTDGPVVKQSNIPDSEVYFTLAKSWGQSSRFVGYWTGAVTYYGQSSLGTIPLEEVQFSSSMALEWRFRDRISFVFQYLISTPAVEGNLDPFSKPSHEVVLGWKGEFREGVLEFGLLENLFTSDNSPDFGLHLGYSVRF